MTKNSTMPTEQLTIVADIYLYFDGLFELDDIDSDTLFASSYLRGLISLVATEFGDESQAISADLIDGVSEKIILAKTELAPQDYAIVNNFWLAIQQNVTFK
ncbi:YfcL family protein [Colwellia psychrerythraea]|uniref:YfcL protein n=1 Tax=Colwellia psychrerythraea TaxID=28229 RepID=A0A099KSM0_COLPS|nr:YfcL family protein [Colwellia psychrerythraea]KGJ93195.1 YfcL protein [Colwellia psychrerythraea]